MRLALPGAAAWALCGLLLAALLAAWPGGARAASDEAASDEAVARGAYLVRAAGCKGCHTQTAAGAVPYAGGRPLKTPFGTYYSPNITPDPDTGIGTWSDADFVRALHEGLSPDGGHYFPVFPYTSYTRMRAADALAIKAYLFSLPPTRQVVPAHDVGPPFGWRWTIWFWNKLFFAPGVQQDDPARDATWNRGAYLVEALAHCGECHTPRNALGGFDLRRFLAGTKHGPDGDAVSNITPDPATGIGDWSEGDIVTLLRDGLKPDFDDVQGSMAEAIEDGLKYLDESDLRAIAVYLRSLPPIHNPID